MLNTLKKSGSDNPYLLSRSKEAVVDEIIRPNELGRIRYRGSIWNAKCLQEITIDPEEIVYVVGNDNITLIVDTVPHNDDNYPCENKKKSPSVAPLFFLGNFLLLLLMLL
ncbi:NfeD family protein [Hydrocoleum sp. CS-953]|uniref:NfeD family protein n=1 Tax=Microcoleaceae TaxID=1892252 RepID=UPI00117A904D|nr:NfeD family protein [Hydrocoleum sp. CS-953]